MGVALAPTTQELAASFEWYTGIYNLNSGDVVLLKDLATVHKITALKYSPQGNLLVTTHDDGTQQVWTLQQWLQ